MLSSLLVVLLSSLASCAGVFKMLSQFEKSSFRIESKASLDSSILGNLGPVGSTTSGVGVLNKLSKFSVYLIGSSLSKESPLSYVVSSSLEAG